MTYFEPSSGDGVRDFNYVGVELSFDFTTLNAAVKRHGEEAHFRIAGLFIAAIRDDWPWLLTLGLGAVWY